MTTTTESRKPKFTAGFIAKLFVVLVCGLAFAFVAIGFMISMLSGKFVGSRDFVVYWATGQQLVHHANPYDGQALFRMEHVAGLGTDSAMYMRNPPSALPLVYPLGFLGLWAASIIWSLLLFASLLASVRMLWVMHGRPKNHRHWIGYSFGPALLCMIMGQTTLFALLGLVLFLRLHQSRPFLAGMSLWLCALKPHLFLPFGVALLAWIVFMKSYKILIGAAAAMAASSAIAFVIDPHSWGQYAQMMRTSGVEWEFIPCVSVLLRKWINERVVWIEYVPAVLACAWAIPYYWRRRFNWDWMKQGSLLMLVSLVSAPYSWIYDSCLAIPPLLQGAYATRSQTMLVILAFLSALIEFALLCDVWSQYAVYLWTLWSAPAWLIWYLFATRDKGELHA
jgi:Glycosyltransferase family 87